MADRYRLAPDRSRFTVQAFATGMLSFFGHSPTFAVRDFTGLVDFANGTVEGLRLEVTVPAGALQLLDQVRPADRREIEGTMYRDVLETAVYPEIKYQAAITAVDPIARGRFRVRLGGPLALHGVTRPHPAEAELVLFTDGVRLQGQSFLRLSDYRIRPVTALGGTIRLKDELKVGFDLAALPEGP